MSNSSSGSSRTCYIRGIPSTCGQPTTILKSTAERNPGREFYRCTVANAKSSGHVFKWAKESQLEEYDVLSENQGKIVDDFGKMVHCHKLMMDTLEKVGEKTKTLESEVKTLKESFKRSVICVAVVGCLYWSYRLF